VSVERDAPDPGVYATPNRVTPNRPVLFDGQRCNGCNRCVNVCVMDIFIPNPAKGGPPLIIYPDECWYDGACVLECPRPGAIRLNHPLTQRVRFKRKETGQHFRT
jgi:NAD-dependent dihydropyrimidine dehydrogenase PreA subunit